MIGSTVFYKKKRRLFSAKLSLVALMDIFTILVFFLLLNSGESQKIENAKYLSLPDSNSGVAPHTELNIVIGNEEIMLGEKVVARVSDVLEFPEKTIESLAAELNTKAGQRGDVSAYEKQAGLAVTISGDRAVPYKLLKAVMTTCQKSNYRNISLAVNRVSASSPENVGSNGTIAQPITDRIGEAN